MAKDANAKGAKTINAQEFVSHCKAQIADLQKQRELYVDKTDEKSVYRKAFLDGHIKCYEGLVFAISCNVINNPHYGKGK